MKYLSRLFSFSSATIFTIYFNLFLLLQKRGCQPSNLPLLLPPLNLPLYVLIGYQKFPKGSQRSGCCIAQKQTAVKIFLKCIINKIILVFKQNKYVLETVNHTVTSPLNTSLSMFRSFLVFPSNRASPGIMRIQKSVGVYHNNGCYLQSGLSPQGVRVLPEILGRDVQSISQNPYPIKSALVIKFSISKFFYITVHSKSFPDDLQNFNLAQTLELKFFRPLFPRIYSCHWFCFFQVLVGYLRKLCNFHYHSH